MENLTTPNLGPARGSLRRLLTQPQFAGSAPTARALDPGADSGRRPATEAPAAPAHIAYGSMFWLIRNTFSGSYSALIRASRS